MNSVRDMGNLGSHGEHVEPRDAKRALEMLLDLVDWYLGVYHQPTSDGTIAKPEGG
jgi:hypothetical protein